MKLLHRSAKKSDDPALNPSGVLLWVAVTIAVTVGLTAFLVRLSDDTNPQRLSGLLDILRIGLSIGVGTGGLFALWLATRRQRSAEQTLALQREVSQTTVVDSTERRITEQYYKAIEQLGHEKAAVRLGAVYSLERLAQEHAQHRQTIIDVFCSYLRLPYEPPANRRKLTSPNIKLSPETVDTLVELEVRYTIQGMFWEHMGDPEKREMGDRHWPDLELDLSRTILIDPILRYLSVRVLNCQYMTVYGIADFRGLRAAEFTGLFRSHFHDRAIFTDSALTGHAAISECTFDGELDFSGSSISTQLVMIDCNFRGPVKLGANSPQALMVHKCQFDHDLVLSEGNYTGLMIFESDFQKTLITENLAVPAGAIVSCSFQIPPKRHATIVRFADMQDVDRSVRDLAVHFNLEPDLEQ